MRSRCASSMVRSASLPSSPRQVPHSCCSRATRSRTGSARRKTTRAEAEHGDVILCQITSRPWSSSTAIRIDETDVVGDGLQRVSYARPDKLFTASASLVMGSVGRIRDEKSRELRRFVRRLFEDGLPAD